MALERNAQNLGVVYRARRTRTQIADTTLSVPRCDTLDIAYLDALQLACAGLIQLRPFFDKVVTLRAAARCAACKR